MKNFCWMSLLLLKSCLWAVSRAVSKLKKKAPGPDGWLAKHLKAGGEAVVIWLMNILNATVELESVLQF